MTPLADRKTRLALRAMEAGAEGIVNLIQEQVDQKIRGEREHYDWKSIISTINDQAESMKHEARAALQAAAEGNHA